ncbi:hypothetical protein CC80DRAFT_401871 [Byssothecium circinans]|uniref:Serine peptidase n=1 Tax=Byssothecium circinans TaxID=147558 RepID=A0A6A5UB72_9PLEO|nr:hypothetical protein CC80DRAFT_401871 [Byssothecium circinans]
MHVGPIEDDDTQLLGGNGTNGWGTFDQLIDHSNPSLGTFKQRFWFGSQYWKGTGSPIILVNPGEQPADGFNVTYTAAARLTGLMAQKVGGAVVIMEHRYWGESSPFDELTVENLEYLTLENSIKDLTYFAKNFDAPFDKNGTTDPKKTPWVFGGGSYSGALAGWTAVKDPGVFWAYYGTSGVVESVSDFWMYFEPVREATPANCTADQVAVINYIDGVLLNGTAAQKKALKDKFKLGDLEDTDFGGAIENGPWTWQGTQFYSESTVGFNAYYRFCDYIENVPPNSTNQVPGPEGVGVEKALEGYAKWFTEISLPGYCEGYGYDEFNGTYNTECFKYLNKDNAFYKDLTVESPVNRQWMWMLCNEPFEYWQNGAPKDTPSLVSRLVNNEYYHTQCANMFGSGYGLVEGKTVDQLNEWTGGWFATNTTRLMYANGQYDPWLPATVSAKQRPGGPLESTPQLPVRVIPGGMHCSDLYGPNWAVNEGVKAIADAEVEQMAAWVKEFYDQYKPVVHGGSVRRSF